ncbi:AbrB family transcriptional regulator [Roseomonas sp. CAU 1739]|uniref:AbrB family transcriptional regulator n=1 Tax=Roseomonas sp. CAU 1739 TaxID=3140364 RepID=UPI00325AFDBF
MADTPPRLTDSHLRTLLLSLLAGGLLTAVGLPLGWMIGALVATAYLTIRDAAAVPATARPAGLIVLGLALGQGFTAPVLEAVAAALPAMLVGGMLVLLTGAAVAPLYRRIARVDGGTALFACIPGGVVAMAMLAAQAGVAVPAVTIAQSIRMATVVLTYPALMGVLATPGDASVFAAALPPLDWGGLLLLLAGGVLAALAGRRIGLANAAMFAPCLLALGLSANGALPSGVPRWMVDAAQVAMGASLGAHLAREGLGSAPQRLVLAGLASGAAVSALLVVAGLGLGWAAGLPLVSVVLGLAPGGLPEMVVTAQALVLAVPLVLGLHLVRMVLVNLLAVPLWRVVRWWAARR